MAFAWHVGTAPDEIPSPRKGTPGSSTELRAEDGAVTRLHANLWQGNQAESRPEAPAES